MEHSDRALWALLCVALILVLVLAALLLARARGKGAAAVGGAALLGGRRRPRERFGGSVGDIWTIPMVGNESISATSFNPPFFPSRQMTARASLASDWTAIRAAYGGLDRSIAQAWAADTSYSATKGAARTLAPGKGIAGRTVGTWQSTYANLDNVLDGLGKMIELYKVEPPRDADQARFNALKASLVNGLLGQPPGNGYLAQLHNQVSAVGSRVIVQQDIATLAGLIAALPPPVTLPPLPPIAAAITNLAPGAVKAHLYTQAVEDTVRNLRDAYVKVRTEWGAMRGNMPPGSTALVADRDARLAACENLVAGIIMRFTGGPAATATTAHCERDRAALQTEIGRLSAGNWGRGARVLAAFSDAALNLARCLPSLPPVAVAITTLAAGNATAQGHIQAAESSLINLRGAFVAMRRMWEAKRVMMPPSQAAALADGDARVSACEVQVAAIIGFFTSAPAASATTTPQCSAARAALLTEVRPLNRIAGNWSKGDRDVIAALESAAARLALCLPALPPPAARITNLGPGVASAQGHGPAAVKTLVALRDAYNETRQMWLRSRITMTAAPVTDVTDRDARLAVCEACVDRIIDLFTSGPATGTVTGQCVAERAKLLTAIGVLGSGAWGNSEAGVLAKFERAATLLGLCLVALPPVAAAITALRASDAVAQQHSPTAAGTLVALRDTYANARQMWEGKRGAMPSDMPALVADCDTRLAACEAHVGKIIAHFTTAAAIDAVATQCEVDRAALQAEIKGLSAAGRWVRSELTALNAFAAAAADLALCLPPSPPPLAKAVSHATNTPGANDFTLVGRHALANGRSVADTCLAYANFVNWWRAWPRREAAATYRAGTLAAALAVEQLVGQMAASIGSLVDAYLTAPTGQRPAWVWPLPAVDQCANAIAALGKGYKDFGAAVNLPARGIFLGYFAATPPWEAFRSAIDATYQIDLPAIVIPPALNARILAGHPELAHQHPPYTVQRITAVAGELERVIRDYSGGGQPILRETIRAAGRSGRAEPALTRMIASLATLVALYASTKTATAGVDSATAKATAIADVKTFSTEIGQRGQVIVANLLAHLNYLPLIASAPYEGEAKPLTASQRLIHLTYTPDVEAVFSKAVAPDARGILVIEAASEEELDAKLAQAPDVAARVYGLVVDKPGDLTALYKAVAINIGARVSADIESKQADVARAATGRLYTATRLPAGGYFKQLRDYVKPALYAVA